MSDSHKKYLSTEENAELIGRSAGAVRNLVLRRAIPFRKAGGRLVFLRSEIEDWIEQAPGLSIGKFKEKNKKNEHPKFQITDDRTWA